MNKLLSKCLGAILLLSASAHGVEWVHRVTDGVPMMYFDDRENSLRYTLTYSADEFETCGSSITFLVADFYQPGTIESYGMFDGDNILIKTVYLGFDDDVRVMHNVSAVVYQTDQIDMVVQQHNIHFKFIDAMMNSHQFTFATGGYPPRIYDITGTGVDMLQFLNSCEETMHPEMPHKPEYPL